MLTDVQERVGADQGGTDVRIPPLDGEGPVWLQIRRSMAMAILTGEWPAGMRIPTELFLTSHYAAARMTVNKALQSLASEGLVERRPKVGTVVTARARERPVFEIWDAASAVQRTGGQYGYRLLECGMVPDGSPLRAELELAAATPTIRMMCLHLSDGRPFQLEERLINVEAAPRITCQPLEDVSPGQWLLANVPWTEARHAISARGATAMVATHLALREGDACLVVERRTWNGTVPVTLGRFWYPGDDHRLEGQFRPSW
ncbi:MULTISPECIES: UTRA domain-containing protein [unclassified Sphingomonas]|uniref:UTRA domain-containing protein n=1 Tax=unclassified Sphingomonas TaxID=196159 RepID=UPI000701730F|nr:MULTISPECIES: UTRA domain-containing protein [unclassified Sphingomonas]KQM63123.1 GntR family transcriptional regulator [Sphingomonas sp. Leaf16]KQN14982.1 GntR family transcriptional regulator [Sphingomonas sp. Leaf29]KQN20496.1 GntR family transcriptional regulator [Sphingomonas sp. Leaf32]